MGEPNFVHITDLTLQDWNEIYTLAVKFYKSGAYGGHMGKCWIHGFVHWLGAKNLYTSAEQDDYVTFH